MNIMNVKIYDEQADTISVDDIATNINNQHVMRRMKNNNANDKKLLFIQNQHDEDGEDCVDYVPEGTYDMGWMGYFVGKNQHLYQLVVWPFTPTSGADVRDVVEPFFRGVCNNKSIHTIRFIDVDLLGGEMFTMLGSFFKNNHNLTNITTNNCDFGDDGARLFALALGSSTNKSLKEVDLQDSNIDDEGLVDILTALSMHPHLEYLNLDGNRLRKNGCVALATLLQCSAKKLRNLFIRRNEINDDGIGALVPALANCTNLQELRMNGNPSITTRGWQILASILKSPTSNLQELGIAQNNIDDEAAAAFANSLANNCTLYIFNINSNIFTAVGWEALSKLLCNTSSVNATFLSNHTLQYMGNEVLLGNANILEPFLHLNRREDKKEVAMIKIFQNHEDFDMLPFFEWEFKVLPLVLRWLERASEYEMPEDFEANLEERKLSTIYQFVRGMPLLYVETRLRKELEDIKAEESKLEEEQQKSEQRKQYLQERKDSIVKKLGGASYNIKHRT